MRNKSYKDIKGVEILTVYDIQGEKYNNYIQFLN